jgi:hypothetical protein
MLGWAPIGKLHAEKGAGVLIDRQQTRQRLRDHLYALTVTIGERSVSRPENLRKTVAYISSFYKELGLAVDTHS